MGCTKTVDSYLISNKCAKILYDNLIPFCLPIDFSINPIFVKNNMNVYWAEPALIHQGSEDFYASSAQRPIGPHSVRPLSGDENAALCLDDDFNCRNLMDLEKYIYNIKNNIEFKLLENKIIVPKNSLTLEQIRFFRAIKASSIPKILISTGKINEKLINLLNINIEIKIPNIETDYSEQIMEFKQNTIDNKQNIIVMSIGNIKNIEIFEDSFTVINLNNCFDALIYDTQEPNTNKMRINNDIIKYLSSDNNGCGEGSFNGCQHSEKIIDTLIKQCNIEHFIETGTYRGFTTTYMANNYPNIDVITIEYDEELYNNFQKILTDNAVQCSGNRMYKNVYNYFMTSIEFFTKHRIFVERPNTIIYLDDHWDLSHPLYDQLKLLNTYNLKKTIIIIDDFHVPGRNFSCDYTNKGQRYDMIWINELLDNTTWSYFYKSKQLHSTNGATGWIIFYTNDLSDVVSKFITIENDVVYDLI